MIERAHASGIYTLRCVDRAGREVWRSRFQNTVVTVGMDAMLDAALSGVNYTVAGPYLGFISSVSFTGISASDTLPLHPGWLECGATYPPFFTGGARPLAMFAASSGGSAALAAPVSVMVSGAGTIEGCFLVFGADATPLIDSTTGVLYSTGLGAGAPFSVSIGATVEATYSTRL